MKYLFAFVSMFSLALGAAEISDVKVKALDGFGGDLGAVASRCQTKKGAEYDAALLTRDVNTLKDSGEFETINVETDQVDDKIEVVFFVKRKIRYVAPLVIEGADALSESKIAKEAELKDGYLYSEGDLSAAAQRVRLAYLKKHYGDAKVMPKTEIVMGNNAKITFVIDEGEKRKVASYVFDGCESIDEAELHEAIEDYPWWNPVGWFTDDPVTEDQKVRCCEKISKVYRDHGYLDVLVTGPKDEPTEDGKKNVVFNIVEGREYRIGKMSITGLTKYSEEDVRAKSDFPIEGVVAAENVLEDTAHRVKVAVGSGDFGLAESMVEIRRLPAEEDGVLDIVFKVTEGHPVVIEDVIIRGNDYTKDKVIRREISLGPGDRMLEDHAERSQKRLENLDYFSRVRYYLEETPNKGTDQNGAAYRNLVYEIEEKNTGSFMVGVGASSVDSVYVSAEVSQANFDLFAPSKLFRGAGQKARFYVAAGQRYQSVEASLTEPHLFDRLLQLDVEAYRRLRWYDEYDLIRTGGGVSLSYPVKFWPTWNPFGRFGVRLGAEFIEFDDIDHGTWTYKGKDVSLREEDRKYGDAFEPTVGIFWSHDTRDNFRIPTTGSRTRIFADVAPAGDNEYWRLGFNHRNYFTIWERYHHVLMIGLRGETIDGISDDVPIYNRMFLGGPRSIRGVRYRNVSPFAMPKAGSTSDSIPWGGQSLFCANVEYTIPIVKMLRFAIFTDAGAVGEDVFDLDFDDCFAWSAGAGLRLDLPMFPIRLDLAYPIEKPDEAEKEAFSFTVGYDF